MKAVPAPLGMSEQSRTVFGVVFTEHGSKEIATMVTETALPAGSGLRTVLTMNLDHVVTLRHNVRFGEAYQRASLVTADGFPVYLYARMRGARLAGRVTGSDMFPLIMERLRPGRHRPFLIAASEQTARRLDQFLEDAGFTADQYGIVVPDFGFEHDKEATERLLRHIESLRPTHIFLGVGAPKSEIWLDTHRERLGDAYAFAFGASLDFFVGTVMRAPRILRESGFEWLWRFASEPRRLFRRYFVQSWTFFAIVADDLRRNGHPFFW